jgi:hypothetical protein
VYPPELVVAGLQSPKGVTEAEAEEELEFPIVLVATTVNV